MTTNNNIHSIYCFTFLYRLLFLWSINDTLKYFLDYFNSRNTDGQKIPGYVIKCFIFNVYVIEDGSIQRQVLTSDPVLTSFNRIFNSAHGLKNTINNFDTTDPLWKILHSSVKEALCKLSKFNFSISTSNPSSKSTTTSESTTSVESTFSKSNSDKVVDLSDLLINKLDEAIHYNLGREVVYTEFVNEFSLRWFSEFMMGSNPSSHDDFCDFCDLRQNILSVLSYTFHTNPFRKVPIIGSCVSAYRRYRSKDKINNIRERLRSLIPKLQKNTFWYDFYRSLSAKAANHYFVVDEVFIDNAFISVLVYDFLHIVLQGILLEKVTRGTASISLYNFMNTSFKGTSSEKIAKGTSIDINEINDIIRQNFLFPFRGRTMTQDVRTKDMGLIRKGDLCLLNLVSEQSNTIFSYGLRSCPGQMIVTPLLRAYVKRINELVCCPTNINGLDHMTNNKINRSTDTDLPVITSNMRGLIRDPGIINKKDMIPTFNRDNSTPLRNIWSIYTNNKLMVDIMTYFRTIQSYDPIHLNFDVIVAPEARALPLAGMISNELGNLPIIVMTKTDKFGKTISESYKRGHTDEVTTIHLYKSFEESIKGKKILFVDDGLATGGTTLACMNLIKQMGGNVVLIFVIVKHNYCALEKEYERQYSDITYNCYDLNSIDYKN